MHLTLNTTTPPLNDMANPVDDFEVGAYKRYLAHGAENRGILLRTFKNDDVVAYQKIKARLAKSFEDMDMDARVAYLESGKVPPEEMEIIVEEIDRFATEALFSDQSFSFPRSQMVFADYSVSPQVIKELYIGRYTALQLKHAGPAKRVILVPNKLFFQMELEAMTDLVKHLDKNERDPTIDFKDPKKSPDLVFEINQIGQQGNISAQGFFHLLRYFNIVCKRTKLPPIDEYKTKGPNPSPEEIEVFSKMEEVEGENRIIRLSYPKAGPMPPFVDYWRTTHYLTAYTDAKRHVLLAAWTRYVGTAIRNTPNDRIWSKVGATQNWFDDAASDKNQNNRRAKARAAVRTGNKYFRSSLLGNNTSAEADEKAAAALGVRPAVGVLSKQVEDLDLKRKQPAGAKGAGAAGVGGAGGAGGERQAASRGSIQIRKRAEEPAKPATAGPSSVLGTRRGDEDEPMPDANTNNNNNNNNNKNIGVVYEIDDD